ncbi:serine/threonine-protein kinase 35-like [Branchiostoma floridae]|uniref:Serine/threonine-protein kinase 35-like n=1 Tax=Branchiostoma floridae TaxID=7739 RepID=A0A9J7N1S6_BRAFL|nr:serine/threonine-protein kinase 35-like [Branchiostoma floridae]
MEKYTILHELGQGAFSKVYKAERNEDGSTHALKCLTVDSVERGDATLKEIHALQQVGKHPNILQFTNVFTESAGLNTPALNVWLELDYCNGGTLDSFIASDNPNRATVLQLLCDTAEGVAYLHGRNVVHGSLKPDNILVDNSGQRPIAKIADFGMLRVRGQGGWDIKNYFKETSGIRMYLSPEIARQLLAQRPHLMQFTAKADVFALGLIIVVILNQTTDPVVPATDPAISMTDPGVSETDPAKPGKLVPAVYVNGKPTAVGEVMVTRPGYQAVGMLMMSEPQGSPVKVCEIFLKEGQRTGRDK